MHRELCSLVGQTGTESVAFATDAGGFSGVGYRCVIFGPGDIKVAHRANEFVPIAELERAGMVLDELIRRRCRRMSRLLIQADLTWLDGTFSPGVTVAVNVSGRIESVGSAQHSGSGAFRRLEGMALLPGFVNAHSHAFQRGLRGAGERFSREAGTSGAGGTACMRSLPRSTARRWGSSAAGASRRCVPPASPP